MKRYLVLSLLIAACVPPPPLGSATKKAFDAQAQAGQKPNGASQLTTDEVRKIFGQTSSPGGNNATKKASGPQVKEPINTEPQ